MVCPNLISSRNDRVRCQSPMGVEEKGRSRPPGVRGILTQVAPPQTHRGLGRRRLGFEGKIGLMPLDTHALRPRNADELADAGRRTTQTLFLAMSAASAGTIGVATVNSILAADLGGRAAWAGFPSAVYLLAAALLARA